MDRLVCGALALVLLSGAAVCAQEAPVPEAETTERASAEPATFEDVGAFLDALEGAEEELRALWGQVVYDRRFVLQGDRQIRIGTLAFERTPSEREGEPAERAFEVEFTKLLVGDELREDRQSWSFKGRWLVERRFDDKVFVKRELAPAGKSIDPLRLGRGPMPLPIGQRKADILARYTPELVDAQAGFDAEDESDDGYAKYVRTMGATQLKLTPRADAAEADEKFREIRLWYRAEEGGGLLPVLARTVDRSGDVIFVQLVGVQRAGELPEAQEISVDPPTERGWDVQIERGRFDEDLESVRIGMAPGGRGAGGSERGLAADVHRASYAHPLGQEGPPGGEGGERGGLGDLGPMARGEERETSPVEAPDTSEAVLRAIGARYLTEDERAQRRVFHGLWTESDLEEVAGATARAALDLGVWDHPAFDEDPMTEPLDRIEAMVRRGELRAALEELGPADDRPRAVLLRGEALEGLGRFEEAIAALTPLRDDFAAGRLETAADVTNGAAATWIHARLTGEHAGAYQSMVSGLSDAHQKMDRLYWPAVVLEAHLLESKGNAQESTQAAGQALTMSRSASGAWALLGIRAVRGFAVDNALGVSDRLDRLERRLGGGEAHSPIGDLVAARMYLRLNDPELAERRVARVLARYPLHREALALRCAIDATRYDFAQLEEHLSEFEALSPGHPLALYEAGSALSERRQYAEAAAYLERAAERLPTWPEPLVKLGLMEVQAARDVVARDVLTRATELDPFNTRALNSLALVEGLLTEFATIESEHFIVRYRPGIDEVMAREMLPELEAMHDVVCARMGHVPSRKTLVEVMPDHQWFSVRITGMPQIHTMAAATGPIIAMEAPKIGKNHTGVYNWLRVVRHEYAHTVTLDRTKNRIPLWHTEAAAVEMEMSPRDYRTVRLLAGALKNGTLFDLDKINLGFIRPEKQTDRAQAYAQANWMWKFIDQTWGNQANLEMMDRFAAGQRVPRVLDEMFGLTQRAFMDRFRDWAWEDAKAWGLFPEPSLDALRLEETEADPALGPALKTELRRLAREASRATATGEGVAPAELGLVRPSPDLVDFWSEVYPEHPDVLALRVEAMMEERLGEPRLGDAPLLEAYASARPTDPMPHRHLARLYLRSLSPEKAVEHLEFLDEREVYSPAYAVALARRYAAEGSYERAMAKAERATRIAPFDGDYRELAATVALRAKDYETALRHVEALVTLEPGIEQHKRRLEALRGLMEGGRG